MNNAKVETQSPVEDVKTEERTKSSCGVHRESQMLIGSVKERSNKKDRIRKISFIIKKHKKSCHTLVLICS